MAAPTAGTNTCTRHRTTPEQPKGGTTGEQPAVASSCDRFLRETIHEEPNIIYNTIYTYSISFIRIKHRTRANDILCKTSYRRFSSQKPYYTNVSDVPCSLQSWVSTIQTVVLTADVFQPFIKSCLEAPGSGWPTKKVGDFFSSYSKCLRVNI